MKGNGGSIFDRLREALSTPEDERPGILRQELLALVEANQRSDMPVDEILEVCQQLLKYLKENSGVWAFRLHQNLQVVRSGDDLTVVAGILSPEGNDIWDLREIDSFLWRSFGIAYGDSIFDGGNDRA